MSEPIQQPPSTACVPDAELDARGRRAVREARTEAVIVLALDMVLLGRMAAIDKAKDWHIITLHWWAWLLLASPALLLMVLLLAVPLAEVRPGRARDAGVALLETPGRRRCGRRRDPPRRPCWEATPGA